MEQTAMFLYDRIADRETQTTCHRLGCEIGIENSGREFFLNTRTAVGDRNFDITSRRQQSTGLFFRFAIAGRNVNGAAMRHRLARIDYKRVYDLLDLARIDIRLPKISRDVHLSAQIGTVKGKFSGAAKQFRDRGNPFERRAAF